MLFSKANKLYIMVGMFRLTQYTSYFRSRLMLQQYKRWIHKNEQVLDVGCGDGIISSILAKELNIMITGCDIENYLQVHIPFAIMKPFDKLPFKKNSFGAVMLNDVLHHMSFENQTKIIKEALRVAPKVIIFEDEPTFLSRTADIIINKFHSSNMPLPLTFRKHSEWEKVFSNYPVSVNYHKPQRPFLYPFIHQAFLLKAL